MNARSARKGHVRSTDGVPDRQVLTQEVERLRSLLREGKAELRRESWTKVRHQFRIHVVGLTLVALVVGGLIGHYGIAQTTPIPERTPDMAISEWPGISNSDAAPNLDNQTIATPWPISVYISGAVVRAQVVHLPAGSLVADALDCAGGASVDADLDAVNLASPLSNNQHIIIPRLTDRVTESATQHLTANSKPAAPININTASADELEQLPYIGVSKAADIVSYRMANGPFGHIEDIQNVPGIGPTTYEHIAPLITTEN